MGSKLIARINLLPWREGLRKEKRRRYVAVVLGVMSIAAACVYLWDRHLSHGISIQTARNDFLGAEVALLDARLTEIEQLRQEKQDILARMAVITDLQGTRPLIVHVFDELVRTLPEDVYFELIKRNNNTIAIEGAARSYSRITELVRRLDASVWFRNTELGDISASRAGMNPFTEFFTFALKLTLESPGHQNSDQPR